MSYGLMRETAQMSNTSDLVDSPNGVVSYSTDYQKTPKLFTISTLRKPTPSTGISQRFPFSKTVSLKTFNSIAKSIKSKFSSEKTSPSKQHSRSTECILSGDSRAGVIRTHYDISFSDEEQLVMPTLRRVESDRNGNLSSARKRPSSLYTGSAADHFNKSKPVLSHAQSFDGLNQKYEEQSQPVKLSPYRQSPLSSLSHGIGNHQRSMSHRELTHHSDGIVDAFGFASTNGHPSAYQSSNNIHYNRSEQYGDFQHRKVPEVPGSYQPAPPARNESRSYKIPHNWRSPLQPHKTSLTVEKESFISAANMDKENYQRTNSWEPQRQQRNSFISASNKEPQRQNSVQPVSKTSFGPVVRRAESMKRIMQKNRKAENNNSPSVSNSFESGSNEVVTEKGRSVKSIVGMFDQPAIHAALANAKMQQANDSIREENRQMFEEPFEQKVVPQNSANSVRPDRNGTQVVHIAKFAQVESTPERPANYMDAQTSPMQLSPTEPSIQRVTRPSIAKAETFCGGSKPKVAVMTSSTSSSYMSNEVFTPRTDTMESPVFEADLPYHRTDSSSRTHYSDSTHDGYDLAHDSYIPNSYNQPFSHQHPHIHNQLLRQEQTDTDSSNHYEDLESLRAPGSIHELENIYEPISPMRRDAATGNYMNFPPSPSTDYLDMSPPSMTQPLQQSLAGDRRSLESDNRRPCSLPMDTQSPRHFVVVNGDSEMNESQEEESYTNQVREASQRTLRQTSVEGNKYRSPTREELVINRYNLAKTNVNQVQPVQGTSRSTASNRPQVQSPYNSEANIANHEPVNMRKRPVPHRTDSCRVPPRSKQVDRTSSYRESRGSSMDIRASDPKASIRNNLIDFYKRKSRDSSMDGTLDCGLEQSVSFSLGTSPTAQSPTKAPHSAPMHRIQSERTFNTRNLVNPRSASIERTPSMSALNPHRNSIDMSDSRRTEISHSYMQSWDASSIAGNNSVSTSMERSPTAPLLLNESPRVRKPLVAEVSPFSMPVQKSRKDRPSRLETVGPSSNAGSGVLKPMKAGVSHTDNTNNPDVAPTLPPRNYHPEEITTNHVTDNKQSSSELDLSAKPYQNVFNGNASGKSGVDDYEASYTEQIRNRLAKDQYVKPSTESSSKLSPQHPAHRTNGQQQSPHNYQTSPPNQQSPHHTAHSNVLFPHNNTPASVMSPHNNTPVGVMSPHNSTSVSGMSPHNNTPSSLLSPHNNTPNLQSSHSMTHGSYTSGGSKPQHRHSISVSSPTAARVPRNIPRQQVLETDIDDPESQSEVQPLPPPRRTMKEPDFSKPPPKPPKLSSTIYHHEINHNDPQTISVPSLNQTSPSTQPFAEKIENNNVAAPDLPSMHHKKSLLLSSRLHDGTPPAPQPQDRKERGRSESMISPKGGDLTVTSGDPTAHLNRRHSVGRIKNRRSVSTAGMTCKNDKPNPANRLQQRETEFSAIEKTHPITNERLDTHIINSVVNDNRPKPVPFDRYHPVASSRESLVSHSRHGSSELLDMVDDSSSPVNYRHKDRASPTPPPRSPKLSPVTTRSVRASIGSHCESRKSTPSPHSSSSDIVRQAKSDPSTPVDKSFIPISTEILADLADQGIDITEKHCISDESKARLVKISALNSSSPPASKKAPFMKHIRQKSSDEILCDTQVENLGKSIKDETLSQVLSKPEKGTTDYLPGLFDDLLNKDIPRKPRQSGGSSPYHSKQSSAEDSLSSTKTGSTKDYDSAFDTDIKPVQDQKAELVNVLKKKLSVLQEDERFIKQEIEDNEISGAELVQIVEDKCNEKEVRKFKSYIDDVEMITRLLLKLSRRLARAENELRNAPMDATDDDKKSLEQKRNGLQRQHTDAKALKSSIDRRKALVDSFLNRCLDSEEFKQYDCYISVKLKLIMEISDIEDQVTHCEEQITAVAAISK